MTAIQAALFATCALPGCKNPVISGGDVCHGCQAEFIDYLRPARPDQPVPTEQDLAQRDLDVATAYTRQLEGPERRANQRCWLCEERRTCVRMPAGWECNNCRDIV